MTGRTCSETRVITLGLGLVGVLWPTAAEAHLVTSGLGPLYDGISHLLLSPEDLVPVLAVGLLAGLNGPQSGRRALFVLSAAWLAGGLAGLVAGQPPVPLMVTAASFLVLGLLIAFDWRLSPSAISALAASVGLLHGSLNGAGIAAEGREALGVAGISATVFVLVAIAAAGVLSLGAPWSRVIVRVAGSWVTAIGLLMLGWGLRGM
jgi:hydrogenase/urease accessory protein HupE